jgi:hypothetical protein
MDESMIDPMRMKVLEAPKKAMLFGLTIGYRGLS